MAPISALICVLSAVLLLTACRSSPVKSEEQVELDCLGSWKLYSEKSGQCHEVLGTTPCTDNQRFVLRKPQKTDTRKIFRGECVESVCGDKKFWPETGECVSVADQKKVCPSDVETLGENWFGEGECMCTKLPPHARMNDNPSGKCYELYQRGPCSKADEIFAIPDGEQAPRCIRDVCHEATKALRQRTDDSLRTTVWYEGGCHELEKSGPPCPNNGTLKISLEDFLPGCESLLNSIFDFSKGQCASLVDGKCSEATFVHPNSNPHHHKQKINHMFALFDKGSRKPKPKRKFKPTAHWGQQ